MNMSCPIKTKPFFFEDLWKLIALGLSTTLSGLLMLIGKLSFDFGKKRNNDLHKIEKKVAKIEGRIGNIEKDIFFTDSNNIKTSIGKKTCDINHKLNNIDNVINNIQILIIDELEKLNNSKK